MDEKNNNIADISSYQRYLLILKNLEEERHQQEWDSFIQRLLAIHGMEDNADASPEALSKVDLEVAMARLPLLKEAAPKASQEIEDQIEQSRPRADEILMEAGYEDELRTDEVIDHVATMHVAEQAFPDEDRPSLVERLKNAKGHISSALKSENGSLALSTVMFSVAVGTGGGAALAVSGALYAANLMKNGSVQNFMSRIESKISDTLVRFGFKEENVEERKVPLGERMKAIASNPWFKATTAVAAVGLVGVGVGSLLANGGMDAIKEGYDTVMNTDYSLLMKELSVDARNLAVGTYEGVMSLPEITVSVYDSIANGASEVGDYLSDSFTQVIQASESTAQEVIDKTTGFFPVEESVAPEPEADSEPTTRSSGPALGDDLVPGPETPEADVAQLTEADVQSGHVAYEVKEGDNAWNIVKSYLTDVSGTVPTDAQIDAVVDDLGLETPDLIHPGDTINLPADVQQYGVVPGNEALISDDPFVAEPPPEFSEAAVPVPTEVDISRYVDYDEILKVHGLYETMTLYELQQMNPDLDFGNLSPGDTMTLHPDADITYTVPSVEQMIIETAFPNGAPENLDTSQYVKDVLSLNDSHNLKEGWFGVQALNGNPLLGQEILNNGTLQTPAVDVSSLTPESQGQLNASGRNVAGALEKDILSAAFPEGTPKYLDEQAFVSSVKDANPGLSLIQEGDYYSESFVLPGTEAAQNSQQMVQDFNKEEAINSFRDRFMSMSKTGPEPA